MNRRHLLALGATVSLSLLACQDASTSPRSISADATPLAQQAPTSGTGLVIDNVTGTTLPLIGNGVFHGELVITRLALNAVGGLVVTGTIIGRIGAVGQTINQSFTTNLLLSSTGGTTCSAVTINLAPINVSVAGQLVAIDVTKGGVTVGAQGPVGNLLCALTSALNSGVGSVVSAVLNIVNAILAGGLPTPNLQQGP
jgi:hypothetical protein